MRAVVVLFLFERGPITRRSQYRIVVAAAAPPGQVGRWVNRLCPEPVPPRLRDGFRLFTVPPPSPLGFCYFCAAATRVRYESY